MDALNKSTISDERVLGKEAMDADLVAFQNDGESGYISLYNSSNASFDNSPPNGVVFSTPQVRRRSIANSGDHRSLYMIPESPIGIDKSSENFDLNSEKENNFDESGINRKTFANSFNISNCSNILRDTSSCNIQLIGTVNTRSTTPPLPDTPKINSVIPRNAQSNSYKKRKSTCHEIKSTNVKRRLIISDDKKQLTNKNKFYNGTTYVQMIEKLEPYPVALDLIFQYLSDDDLHSLSLVSDRWQTIVYSNSNVRSRVFHIHKLKNDSKENTNELSTNYSNIARPRSEIDITNKSIFGIHNTCSIQTYNKPSPYNSPSKRRFYENQKIVKTLSGEDKLIKCPRCSKESRIITSVSPEEPNRMYNSHIDKILKDSTNSQHNESIMFPKRNFHRSLPSFSMYKSHSKREGKLFNTEPEMNRLKNIVGKKSYGECSRSLCQFKFCLQCLCEYHFEKPCITKSISPSKEDVENGVVQVSITSVRAKKTKHKLLKRLFL